METMSADGLYLCPKCADDEENYTLRSYHEIYTTYDGEFVVDFHGTCYDCGFVHKFKHSEMMVTEDDFINNIKAVIEKLPHSADRVPYTYHHDLLRTEVFNHDMMTRAEVADVTRGHSDVWRYAASLTYLLNTLSAKDCFVLDKKDKKICEKAMEISESFMSIMREEQKELRK